jgi:hypothetical protein
VLLLVLRQPEGDGVSVPEVVITVEDGRGSTFRVVMVDAADEHGVINREPVIEKTYHTDLDALGVQRWTRLTRKDGGLSEWIIFANALLKHVLAERESQ